MEVDQFPVQEMGGVLKEVSNTYKPYMEKIYQSDPELQLKGLKEIRDFVIGNNRQKSNFIVLGVITRTIYLMNLPETEMKIKIQCAVILGSLALGTEENIKSLLHYNNNTLQTLAAGLEENDQAYYETCLRCIRSIALSKSPTAHQAVINQLPNVIAVILDRVDWSNTTQECTCEIINACCKMAKQQQLFSDYGAVKIICSLATSNKHRIRLRATQALASLCYKNPSISHQVFVDNPYDIREILFKMVSRTEKDDIQLNAACCLTNIYRSEMDWDGVESSFKIFIQRTVAPCLVRMCDVQQSCKQRILAANTVAYLMQTEPVLQHLIYNCEHFTVKLESYLKPLTFDDNKIHPESLRKFKEDAANHDLLMASAFLAYAALLSNDEELRKNVASDQLVKRLVEALDNKLEEVRIASLQCLLSLSRSIQVLRTFFENQEVWQVVAKLTMEDNLSDAETSAVCALLSNLLLEFSPSKSQLLEEKVLDKVFQWCKAPATVDIRRNALYALTNVTFKSNTPEHHEIDEKIPTDILELIGHDTLQVLVLSDDQITKIKTLDLIFNMIALLPPQQTEVMMAKHGDLIIKLLMMILERPLAATQQEVDDKQGESASVFCASLRVVRNIVENEADLLKFIRELIVPKVIDKLIEFCNCTRSELVNEAVNCLCSFITVGDDQEFNYKRLNMLRSKPVIETLEHCIKIQQFIYSPEKIKEAMQFMRGMNY